MSVYGDVDAEALQAELIRDEGIRLQPYSDHLGNLTIGIGHNLSRGLTRDQVQAIYEDDVREVLAQLRAALPWWPVLDGVRKRVLVNMAFNMGPAHFVSEFAPTLRLVADGDYREAAKHMRASLWARQVGARAERLARTMETDEAA